MLRKLSYVVSVVSLAGVAFAGASLAINLTENPDLPSWLPASRLPVTPVPQNDRVAINNLIPAEEATRLGVNDKSFEHARVLSVTSEGPLYVVPGTSGICLALATTVACSDDLTDRNQVVVALFAPTADHSLVGGGLVSTASQSVAVVLDDGNRITARRTDGGFVVSSTDKISADHFAGLG